MGQHAVEPELTAHREVHHQWRDLGGVANKAKDGGDKAGCAGDSADLPASDPASEEAVDSLGKVLAFCNWPGNGEAASVNLEA